MLKSVEGIYRDGRIELLEPAPVESEGRVIVTFLDNTGVDLAALGIDETQAADLRHRLKTFAEDWDRPEMDVYDEARPMNSPAAAGS
jgi:hypothetical protein